MLAGPEELATTPPTVENDRVALADGPMNRCGWAKDELSIRYHDEEWGVPVHDDRRWFEFLVLEGAQAGLSWDTILRKRENYRRAFAEFDPAVVAAVSRAEDRGTAGRSRDSCAIA